MDQILVACPICSNKVPPSGVEKHVQQCLAEQEEKKRQQQEAITRMEEFQRLQNQMLEYQKIAPATPTVTAPTIGLFYPPSSQPLQPQQQPATQVVSPQQSPIMHQPLQPVQQPQPYLSPQLQRREVEAPAVNHQPVQQPLQPQQQPQQPQQQADVSFNPFADNFAPAGSPAKNPSAVEPVVIAFNPFAEPLTPQPAKPPQQPQQYLSPQLQRREVETPAVNHQPVSRPLFVDSASALPQQQPPQPQQPQGGWVSFGDQHLPFTSSTPQQPQQPQQPSTWVAFGDVPPGVTNGGVVHTPAPTPTTVSTENGDGAAVIPPPDKKVRSRKTSRMPGKALSQSSLPTRKAIEKRQQEEEEEEEEAAKVRRKHHQKHKKGGENGDDLDDQEEPVEGQKEGEKDLSPRKKGKGAPRVGSKRTASNVPRTNTKQRSQNSLDDAAIPKKSKGIKAFTIGRAFIKRDKSASASSPSQIKAKSKPSSESSPRTPTRTRPAGAASPAATRSPRSPGQTRSPGQVRSGASGDGPEVRWFWKNHHKWEKYDRPTSDIIDKAYRENKATIGISKEMYIDFKLLVQKSYIDPLHRSAIKRKIKVVREGGGGGKEYEQELSKRKPKESKKEKLTFT